MLGKFIFIIVIVFMFVNTDQSIAGSYITKKSDVTKEEKKLKKEYIKKKKKSCFILQVICFLTQSLYLFINILIIEFFGLVGSIT